jgi:mycobactin peptide synthetase MbtE
MPLSTTALTLSSSVHEPIFARADRSPNEPAITYEGVTLGYGELATQARQVAGLLIDRGVEPGGIVAVDLPRSLETAGALLGTLGAGAAYMALDPAWPERRKDDIVAATQPAIVLASQPGAPRHGVPVIDVADLERAPAVGLASLPDVAGHDPCCVYYTSGSTGTPKGVVSPHSGTVRQALSAEQLCLRPDTVTLQASALSWDVPSFELWGTLLRGGRCVVSHEPALTPTALRRFIAGGVNTLWLTMSLLNTFVDEALDAFEGLRVLWTGGERLSVDHVRRLVSAWPELAVLNVYGPVEGSGASTVHRVTAADVAPGSAEIPIGRPSIGTEVYLLSAIDGNGEATTAPPGQPGEICLAGAGIGIRYLGEDQGGFTQVRIDGIERRRIYRTGDYGVLRPDGSYGFRGRRDKQVKLRGFRIEPREVEAAIARHPAVAQVTVAVLDSKNRGELVAWLTTTGGAVSPAELGDWLQVRLPRYLVPTAFVVLPRLPLRPSGKLDAAALPAPTRNDRPGSADGGEIPSAAGGAGDAVHADEILSILRELLDIPDIALDDDIIQLGADSLTIARLSARISRALGRELSPVEIFDNPSGRQLAGRLALAPAVHPDADDGRPAYAGDRAFPLSAGQQRFWFAEAMQPGHPANLVALRFAVDGELSRDALEGAFAAVLRRHESLRTIYQDTSPEPLQTVLDPDGYDVPFTRVDCASADALEELVAEQARRGFSLTDDLPIRLLVARLGARRWQILLTVHHIAFDGWSERIFLDELARAYSAIASGAPADREPAVPYREYVAWERAWLASPARRRAEAAWRDALAGASDADWRRATSEAVDGNGKRPSELRSTIPAATVSAARERLAALSCPLSVGIGLASYRAARALTTNDDIAIGTVLEGRHQARFAQTVGFLAHTVAVRPQVTRGPLPTQLRAWRATLADAIGNSALPFDAVVAALSPPRSHRHPVFQFLYVVQHEAHHGLELEGCRVVRVPIGADPGPFDLVLEVTPEGDELELRLAARPDVLDRDGLADFQRAFHDVMTAVAAR